MIHIEQFIFNPFQENCSLVWDGDGHCAVVDPGYIDAERNEIVALIERKNLKPVCILLTHAHFDHIYGVADFARTYNVPVYMCSKEAYTLEHTNPYVCGMYGLPLPDVSFVDGPALKETVEGDVIEVGSLKFQAIETPGHSRGGLCFLEAGEQVLFSGDTLFAGAIGRTDQPGGDYDQLMKSIFEKLMELDGQVKVIPGHGPSSDIATERMTNPFLQPFNEPYED